MRTRFGLVISTIAAVALGGASVPAATAGAANVGSVTKTDGLSDFSSHGPRYGEARSVSVRVSATDNAGDTVTSTTLRAYGSG